MTKERKIIINELEELARLSVKSLFIRWKNSQLRQYDPLVTILNNFRTTLKTNGKPGYAVTEQWYEMECVLKDVQQWLDALEPMKIVADTDELILDWSVQFTDYLRAKPEHLQLGYPRSFWSDSTGDDIIVRGVKGILRALNAATAQNTTAVKTRTVHLHDLLQYYIELPVKRHIEEEKTLYLKRMTWKLQNVRQKLNQTRDLIIIPIQDMERSTLKEISISQTHLRNARKGMDELLDSLNSWAEYEIQIDERFSRLWHGVRSKLEHVWDKAATFQHPNGRYKRSKSNRERKKFNQRHHRIHQEWSQFLEAVTDGWVKDLELSVLQFRLGQLLISTRQEFDKRVETQLRPSVLQFMTRIRMIENRIKRRSLNENLGTFLERQKRELSNETDGMTLPVITDTIIQSELQSILSAHLEHTELAMNALSDTVRIFQSVNRVDEPSKVRRNAIPLKKLVQSDVLSQFREKHEALCRSLKEDVEKILRLVSEMDHVIHFHFQDGIAKAQAGDWSDGKQRVLEGLGGVKRLAERVDHNTGLLKEMVHKGLRDITSQCISELESLSKETELSDRKRLYVKRLRKERRKANIKKWKSDVKRAVQYPRTLFSLLARELGLAWRSLTTDEKRREEHAGMMSALSSVLRSTSEQDVQIPFVYRRLFTLDPLNDEKLFIGRERAFSQFERALKAETGPIAVTGAAGVGKSTFINIAVQRYLADYQLIRIPAGKRLTTKEQLDRLVRQYEPDRDASGTNCIFILEDMETLFLRTSDGYGALKHFRTILNSSDHSVRWIVSVNRAAWSFFDRILQTKSVFRHIIDLDRFDHEQIYNMIRGRHLMSGYQLSFRDSLSGKDFPEPDHPVFLSFFEGMLRASNGNLRAALLYWLNAIEEVREDHIQLKADDGPDFSRLSALAEMDRMVLKMLELHGSLTALELSRIFLWKEAFARDVLARMHSAGYLTDDKGAYTVHDYLRDLSDRILPHVVF